jgi:hypothetical protein
VTAGVDLDLVARLRAAVPVPHRSALAAAPDLTGPRPYLARARDAVTDAAAEALRENGGDG